MIPATIEQEKATKRSPRFRYPFEFFEELQGELGRLWGQTGSVIPRVPSGRFAKFVSAVRPLVDMFEKDNYLVIKADLPGLKREEIQVTLDEGDLIIQGENKSESEVKEEENDYYRLERTSGSLYRRLPLPFEPTTEAIEARFKDGVLEVRIAKPIEKKPQPKHVPVR